MCSGNRQVDKRVSNQIKLSGKATNTPSHSVVGPQKNKKHEGRKAGVSFLEDQGKAS
jgi:hypothetical protein